MLQLSKYNGAIDIVLSTLVDIIFVVLVFVDITIYVAPSDLLRLRSRVVCRYEQLPWLSLW